MKRLGLFLLTVLIGGAAGVALANTMTDSWGGPGDERYGSAKPALPRDWGGGRTCETDRGACPISAGKPLGSICTCSISGGVVSGYVRW
jgi:hypothetical protein